MSRTRISTLLLCLALAVAVGGCGSSPETRLYILDSTAAAGKGASPDLMVGVGPVTFSPYLDRFEIVTLASANQLRLADFDQWAEPLEDGFVRVLTEDLAALLGTDRVGVMSGADVEVAVDVIRFDSDPKGNTKLLARWWIRSDDGETLVAFRKSVISMKAKSPGFGDTVAAMSRAVAKLAGEIAARISAVRASR